jgi:hypothetical protein
MGVLVLVRNNWTCCSKENQTKEQKNNTTAPNNVDMVLSVCLCMAIDAHVMLCSLYVFEQLS